MRLEYQDVSEVALYNDALHGHICPHQQEHLLYLLYVLYRNRKRTHQVDPLNHLAQGGELKEEVLSLVRAYIQQALFHIFQHAHIHLCFLCIGEQKAKMQPQLYGVYPVHVEMEDLQVHIIQN